MKKFLFLFLLLLAFPGFTRSEVQAGCGGPIPPAPTKVWATSGSRAGEVRLTWETAPYANRYAVAYGTKSQTYLYGADNIGGEKAWSYTVKGLQPGVRYYFKLAAAHDSCSSPFSKEVSAVAAGGTVVASGTGIVVSKPTTAAVTPVAVAQTPSVVRSFGVGKYQLTAVEGPKVGEVTLSWQHAENADNYHLVYGKAPGKYQYGALNLGKITKFTVRYLTPGEKYYFALVPLVGNQPLATTSPVAARAKVAMQIVQTSLENLVQFQPVLRKPIISTLPAELISPTVIPVSTSSPTIGE